MIENKINIICAVALLKIEVIPNLTPPQPRARKYSCQISFGVLPNLFCLVLGLMVKEGKWGVGFTGTTFHEKGHLSQRLVLHDSCGKSYPNCLLSPKQYLGELQLKRTKQPAQEPWSHQRETRSQRHQVTQAYSQIFSFRGKFPTPQTA